LSGCWCHRQVADAVAVVVGPPPPHATPLQEKGKEKRRKREGEGSSWEKRRRCVTHVVVEVEPVRRKDPSQAQLGFTVAWSAFRVKRRKHERKTETNQEVARYFSCAKRLWLWLRERRMRRG
jgi:hypothetical protein